ncbi:MAG: SGNH/GDSL hydrolase family protein [Phycisphaeraceae bacterium]|nr:SGNH/GDSL hydrolase family protein [Phycisphaeraceae bacterium]
MTNPRRFALCFALSLTILNLRVYAADQLNLAQTFAHTKQVVASGGQADIMVIGDSLCFEGLGWSSWLPRFKTLVRDYYGDAGAGYQEFSGLTGVTKVTGHFIGSGANVDMSPYKALNGIWLGPDQVGSTVTINTWDQQVDVHYGTANNGGIVTVRDSAGNVLDTIDTYTESKAISASSWSHTFTADDHQLTFEVTGPGVVSLLGVQNTTNNPGIRVDRAANSGYGTSNYLFRDPTFDAQLSMLSPELIIVSLGQNDHYTESQYKIAFPFLIQRLLKASPDSDVLVLGTYDSGSSRLPMIWGVQEQAAANLGVGFLNLGTTAGNKAFFLANNYLYGDNLHHSPAGADYLANLIFDAFVTDGLSLIPEPSALAWLGVWMLLPLRRSARSPRQA